MADPYQPCICGCGKTLKHCAPRAVIHELERIERAVKGNQRIAAMETVKRLLEAHGDLPLLLTWKTRIHFELNELDAAIETLERFVAAAPESPTLAAYLVLVGAMRGDMADAVRRMEDVLESANNADPFATELAVETLLLGLIQSHHPFTAAYLLNTIEVDPGNDRFERIIRAMTNGMSRSHPLQSSTYAIPDLPETEPLRTMCGDVIALVQNFRFQRAGALRELEQQHSEEPIVRQLRAMQQAASLDGDGAAETWRLMAADTSLDEQLRTVAAGRYILFAAPEKEWFLDELLLEYPVEDLDAIQERLLSDKRLAAVNVEELKVEEGQTRPRAAFRLLNKPPLEVGPDEEVDPATLPLIVGTLLTFGRQTDVPPRIELLSWKTNLESCESLLQEICPGWPAAAKRDVVNTKFKRHAELMPEFHMPRLSQENSLKLDRKLARSLLLQRWPRAPHPQLDGLTPAVAARDKTRQLMVAGALLVEELTPRPVDLWDQSWFLELRQQLGLPHERLRWQQRPGDIAMMVEQSRLDVDHLDPALVPELLEMLTIPGIRAMVLERLFEHEQLVQDNQLAPDWCGEVSQSFRSPAGSVRWLERAVAAADLHGQSPARYLVGMLMPLIMEQRGEQVQAVIRRLATKHLEEPGVREALRQILPPQTAVGAAAAPPPPAAEPSRIWTPENPDAGKPGGTSKLILPD